MHNGNIAHVTWTLQHQPPIKKMHHRPLYTPVLLVIFSTEVPYCLLMAIRDLISRSKIHLKALRIILIWISITHRRSPALCIVKIIPLHKVISVLLFHLLCVYKYFSYLYVCDSHIVSQYMNSKEGTKSPWNFSYKQLWAAVCVRWMKPMTLQELYKLLTNELFIIPLLFILEAVFL